jgi:hypothetical protein
MDLKKAVEEAESLRRKLAEQGLSSGAQSYLPQAQASDAELYRQIEALQRLVSVIREMYPMSKQESKTHSDPPREEGPYLPRKNFTGQQVLAVWV